MQKLWYYQINHNMTTNKKTTPKLITPGQRKNNENNSFEPIQLETFQEMVTQREKRERPENNKSISPTLCLNSLKHLQNIESI